MGRTNYSLNELLNAVTKRAFNRYTSQTVDYQHLEAATTKTGLVSNRREYSSASILADTYSLNAANIVESNYDPFLKTFTNNLIDKKTSEIGGSSNTDQFSYAITCTDDRRFLAVTSKFNNSTANEVRVYEFDETLIEALTLTSSAVLDISGNAETFDVDITNDGSETFVVKKVGTRQVVVDKFDQGLNLVSSTTLMTTSLILAGASISVSEDGGRVAVAATSDTPSFSTVFLRVHDNLNTNEYYSLYSDHEVYATPLALMSRNGRIVVIQTNYGVHTFEIPSASPSGVVSISPIQTQSISMNHFDLSHDGKVMLTHSGSDVLIYTWNGLQWKQFGQNIPTGLTQVYSSAISYYADYFVVASDDQIKVYKKKRDSAIFEQHGNTIVGDFGTTGQTIRINMLGNTVVIGNSRTDSDKGSSIVYQYEGETWSLGGEINGPTNGVELGKFVKVTNNGDKVMIGSTNEVSIRTSELVNRSSGWTQRGNTLTATTIDDGFGTSLSISNDGNYLAVGIPDSTSGTPLLDGYQQGSVKIFKFSTGTWSLFGEEILGDGPVDFGKYVSISLNGTKVAIGNDKNSIVRVFTNHTQPQTQTQTVPSASVVDTATLTPQTSLLEMSDDGNRLFVNTGVQGLSIWDKNDAGVWGYRDGLTEGDVIHLSNNGNYLSVDYSNTARLYEIDSNGQMSKIGGDITPSDVSSQVNTFRSNQPTHINTATSNSGVLNLASYVDTTRNVEISSLTWDPTQSHTTVLTSQSSEITGFTVPTGSETNNSLVHHVVHGIALSGNGETLVVYDDTHFHVYTHDGSPSGNTQDGNEWTFRRTKTVSGYQNPLGAFAISYDGTLLAYKGLPVANDEIIIENAVSGTSMGSIPQKSGKTRISFEFRNNYYLVIRLPGVYNPPIYNQWVQQPEQRYHPFLFYEYAGGTMWTMVTHYPTLVDSQYRLEFRIDGTNKIETFRISGDGNTIAFGNSADRKVFIYRYDSDNTTSTSTLLQSGLGSSAAISHAHTNGIQSQQVISGNGNVRVVAHPYNTLQGFASSYPLYSGDVNIYEKNENGDWPSTPSATFDTGFLGVFFNNSASIGISEDGTRVIIGTGGKVFVVHKSGGVWSQLGSYITTFPGSRVAISGDGTTIFNYTGGFSLKSYRFVSGSWVTYLPTLTTDSAIIKIDSSSNGDIIALSKNNSNKVYNKVNDAYQLTSTHTGPMIDISNDGTVVTSSDEPSSFNNTTIFALSGDGTKLVAFWNDIGDGYIHKIRVWNKVNSTWTSTHQKRIGYLSWDGGSTTSVVDLSINNDGSIVGVTFVNHHVLFYDVGVFDIPNGWTSHSSIINSGNVLEDFGSVVDLSNDGNTVLVGAPGDGTSSYRGYIKVYDYASGAWTARSTITTTNSDSSSTTGSTTVSIGYQNFGKSTSLSSNGDRVSYIEDKETVTTTTTLAVSTTDTIAMTGNTFDYDTAINTTHNGGDFGSVTYTTALQETTPYYFYSMVNFFNSDSGIWLPVTFDRSWSVNFRWWGNSSLDFVFYAPNQPSTKDHTQHGGYRIIETLNQRSIVSPTGATLATTSVSYSQSNLTIDPVYGNTGWPWYDNYVRYETYTYSGQRTVYVTYSNGTITVAVPGDTSTQYTFTGSDLTAQQALWGTQTYIGICPIGGQHVHNINVSWDNYTSSTTSNTTRISELSVRDITGGTVSNPIATTADPNRPVVNFSEGRELSAISMSKDGTRIGVRAATGTYDALMKHLETPPNGWTLRGSIIQFTAPGSIASSSVRALVNSSDGNTIAFGMNPIVGYIFGEAFRRTRIKVYGFSNNAWSQLGSDIVPGSDIGATSPNEISIDLSSDGTTLAVLIDRVTPHPAICKVLTFSSGSWSQSGSSIEFRSTGTNKVKISGDGTTIALGNNAPDSPYPFNVIRVYRKNQDWELISPTMMVNKTPTNLFGAGLNLTNNGTKLATFNTSGVEFYTFSTQTETVTRHSFQYLNDITVSGATIDMGDIRFSDSSDRLFVMSGTGHVRVYDNTHTEEVQEGGTLGVRNFSITKDGSYMVLTNNTGLTKVFSRNETSWSQVGNNITANMSTGSVTTDIKSGGNYIVLLGSSDDLQLHKYENGSWSQTSTSTGTRGTSVFISDSHDIIVGDNTNAGRVKTFEIKDVFQDISFTAPTLKLNGDKFIRLDYGSSYVENGATVSTSAAITPAVKISGSVLTREPRVYTINYEVEDLQRKKAEPIFRTVEVIPEVSPIKLEGDSVIYHTQGTSLQDPGVTASVPVNVYHTTPGSSVVVSGFPNFLTATALGEYKIFYTNDSPDKYLRPSPMVTRSVFVRARPVLTRIGPSIVYNPLNQTYVDSGVTFTQSGEASPTVSVSFNAPRIGVSETQTVTYTAKDQFGIEAIPITRQVIVRKRPTITTSGTLYRILNDPISIPAPTVFPETLSGSLQTSNNINRNQLGSYSITYNVTDGDGISANTTRQQYEVGSYGKVTFSQSGTVSAFSRDGRSLAIFSTNIQLYKLGVDGSWESNGSISTPAAVSSMKFSYDGRYIVIGMSSHFTVGLVRVYKENPLFENNWEQLGLDLFGTDYLGKFGHVVEINDFATHIFIGAPEANTNSGALFKAGFVKIYKWNGVFWEGEKTVEGLGPAELLGTSISISRDGGLLAIGSPGHTKTTIEENGTVTSTNVGKTSIYRYVDNVWESYGGTDIDDGTEGGRNAFSLSMTGDGKRLAVGSESGGGVRVYTIQGSRWSPFGSHIPGTFGKSVSLSDENVLVIGSDNESSGRAYVYTLKGDWSKTGTTFDQVIVAPTALNDMGKQVNVNASSTFVCIDSETEVRIYSI